MNGVLEGPGRRTSSNGYVALGRDSSTCIVYDRLLIEGVVHILFKVHLGGYICARSIAWKGNDSTQSHRACYL